MNINVRLLTSVDAQQWQELRLYGLQTDPSAFGSSFEEEKERTLQVLEERFNQQWNKQDNFLLGAFVDQQLVSTAGLFSESHVKRRHIATIWGVYTRPEFRRRGASMLVLKSLLERANQNSHITRISLSVESKNISAMDLYKKFGFVEWGQEPDALYVNGIFHDEVYMSLRTYP